MRHDRIFVSSGDIADRVPAGGIEIMERIMNVDEYKDRIADLELEISYLRAQLGIRDSMVPDLKSRFHLSNGDAKILARLYGAAGQWVLKDVLQDEIVGKRGFSRNSRQIEVYLSHCRKSLGRDAIETSGYRETGAARLSEKGLSLVQGLCSESTSSPSPPSP
jgi:DNA-binding response OmpR family regulator